MGLREGTNRTRRWPGALGVAALLASTAIVHAQPPPATPYRALAPGVRTTLRFATELVLAAPGPTVEARVYTWHVAPRQAITNFPLEGAATFEVRAGEVEATVDGKVATHREGDHFVVPAGSRLRIRTANDSASLQGVVIVRK